MKIDGIKERGQKIRTIIELSVEEGEFFKCVWNMHEQIKNYRGEEPLTKIHLFKEGSELIRPWFNNFLLFLGFPENMSFECNANQDEFYIVVEKISLLDEKLELQPIFHFEESGKKERGGNITLDSYVTVPVSRKGFYLAQVLYDAFQELNSRNLSEIGKTYVNFGNQFVITPINNTCPFLKEIERLYNLIGNEQIKSLVYLVDKIIEREFWKRDLDAPDFNILKKEYKKLVLGALEIPISSNNN